MTEGASETKCIRIENSKYASYEAGGHLISYLAFPDDRDDLQRRKLEIALARWAIEHRANIDPVWAQSATVRAELFSQNYDDYEKILSRGLKIVFRRSACVLFIAAPLLGLKQFVSDQLLTQIKSVNFGAVQMAAYFGNEPETSKTIESRYWASTKPIAHLGIAFGHVISSIVHVSKKGVSALTPRQNTQLSEWAEENPLTMLLHSKHFVSELISVAGEIRPKLIETKKFKVTKDSVVAFVEA